MDWVMIVTGVMAVTAGVLDWEWFFTHRKTRWLVSVIGRSKARVLYSVLGTFLITVGGLGVTGVFP